MSTAAKREREEEEKKRERVSQDRYESLARLCWIFSATATACRAWSEHFTSTLRLWFTLYLKTYPAKYDASSHIVSRYMWTVGITRHLYTHQLHVKRVCRLYLAVTSSHVEVEERGLWAHVRCDVFEVLTVCRIRGVEEWGFTFWSFSSSVASGTPKSELSKKRPKWDLLVNTALPDFNVSPKIPWSRCCSVFTSAQLCVIVLNGWTVAYTYY